MGKADTGRWSNGVGFRGSSCKVISIVWGLSKGPGRSMTLMMVMAVMVMGTILVVKVIVAISCMTRELL